MDRKDSAKETSPSEKRNRGNAGTHKRKSPRIISHPNDIAQLVLFQMNTVNAKKDELTIAIKGLMDTTGQLARVYAQHAQAIQKLQERVKELEEKNRSKN